MSGLETGEVRAKVPECMLFFKKPEVNLGQLRQHYSYIYPRNRLDVTSQNCIEFSVQDATSDFINLEELELQMRVCITKKIQGSTYKWNSSTNVPPEKRVKFKDEVFPAYFLEDDVDIAVPIDAFFQTQWKNVELKLNGEEIAKTNRDQPYRSYMDILLRTSDDEWNDRAYKWLFTKDEGKARKDEPNPYISKDRGAIERSRRFRHGKEVQLAGKLWIDFLKDPTLLLLNGVKMDIKLTPASDAFRIKVSPERFREEFEYEIKDIRLKVPYVTLAQNALRGVAEVLDKHPIMYPYVRTELKVIPLHKGIRDITFPEPFDKQVPMDIVMAMVDVDAYNGNFDMDPFYFNRNHLDYAEFQLDNVAVPEMAIHYQSETAYSDDDEDIERMSGVEVRRRAKRSLKALKMKARKRLKRNTQSGPSGGSATPSNQPAEDAEQQQPQDGAESDDDDDMILLEQQILPENATKYDEWQMRALEMLWNVAGTNKNGFNYKNYKDGRFLFAIKTDPTVPASVPYWPVVKLGNTSLTVRFTEPIPTEQNLLVLARFPAAVTIDKSRKVKVV